MAETVPGHDAPEVADMKTETHEQALKIAVQAVAATTGTILSEWHLPAAATVKEVKQNILAKLAEDNIHVDVTLFRGGQECEEPLLDTVSLASFEVQGQTLVLNYVTRQRQVHIGRARRVLVVSGPPEASLAR